MKGPTVWRWTIAVAAAAFGVATIAAGGRVLFGGASARDAAGAYVPFVLAFNFVAGFAYVAAGFGLAFQKRWTAWVAGCIAVSTVTVFGLLGVHAATGGAFERRTVAAMTVRAIFWIAFFVAARRNARSREGRRGRT